MTTQTALLKAREALQDLRARFHAACLAGGSDAWAADAACKNADAAIADLDRAIAEHQTMSIPDVDWLSNVIRTIDGRHTLGAGALAEKIVEAMREDIATENASQEAT